MDKRQKILLAFLLTGHLILLAFAAVNMPVGHDESGMLLVSKEVINGRTPVLDINAHNQPLFYYFYGIWMKLFGFSIVSARFLSVLSMAAAGLLLFCWAYRFLQNYLAAVLLYLFYVSIPIVVFTNITVEPYAISNLFMLASFVTLSSAYLSDMSFKSNGTLFLSGVLLGISLGARFIFMLPIAFTVWLVCVLISSGAGIKDTAKKAAIFSLGISIPLIPSVLIFILEPSRAYAIWGGAYSQIFFGKGSNPDFMTDVFKDAKAQMMLKGFFDILKKPDMLFFIPAIILSAFIVFFKWRGINDRLRSNVYLLALAISTAIIMVYSNMWLNYAGYRNQTVLFSLVLIAPLVDDIGRRTAFLKLASYTVILFICLAGLYNIFSKDTFMVGAFSTFKPPSIFATPEFVNAVSENLVKRLTRENDVILDTFAIYAFTSNRRQVWGFEYPTDLPLFWFYMKREENAGKYLFIPKPEILNKVEKKEFPLIIFNDLNEFLLPALSGGQSQYNNLDFLRDCIERRYDLYEKYFDKGSKYWHIFYIPKKHKNEIADCKRS